ncbi:MAG TPA: phosphoribosylformylglycinamidine synthase subunit PurL [Candidatus Limnocylindrales bacterium]|nr:phosphoribosylformylglycinamidine synthase subunit PurL [Candidatus Limnocylindrales bacterium]
MNLNEIKVTPEVIQAQGLSPEEYEKIKTLLGREPNITELGIFSVMWSEHCSYKSSRFWLKSLPTQGSRVLIGPGENAGVIDIGDGLAVVMKIESHNHPSFVEPYQGAATGVGGILRDIFTMGARPIAVLNSLRFGDLKNPKTRYLLGGVVAGIAGYGNPFGVPTVGGEVYFEPCYNGNPLVNVMAVGLLRQDRVQRGRAEGIGNPVIIVGSPTGRDGIHGAAFASRELSEKSMEDRPSVQIGDPFTEKKLLEACLELYESGYLVGIQDMGAAGLTCSTSEMAARAGTGMKIYLDQVPLRESGMTPYEIMLSESQERMLMVVKKGYENKAREIFEKWDLKFAVIGEVTGAEAPHQQALLQIYLKGQVVAEIPISSLTDEAPLYRRPFVKPDYLKETANLDLEKIPLPANPEEVFLTLLGSDNIRSKRPIYQQYDHTILANTILRPEEGDAAVLRIRKVETTKTAEGIEERENGKLKREKAIALTTDGNGRYCYLNPRRGAQIAVAEAARNVVCVGAEPIAITDGLNFGSPEQPEVMWQFVETIEGLKTACTALGIPIIGGNVSFYNETNGKAIYPTPIIGMLGLIEEVGYITGQSFKDPGDLIVLLGENKGEIGGSEYLKIIHQRVLGEGPSLDLQREKALQQACLKAIRSGLIKSAHDTSQGGLAICLAESCLTGRGKEKNPHLPGISIELTDPLRWDFLLFGEDQARIVVSLSPLNLEKLQEIAYSFQVPITVLGKVTDSGIFQINDWIRLPVSKLREVWTGKRGLADSK